MNRILNKKTAPCHNCGKEMIDVRRDRKYCCKTCSHQARHYNKILHCLNCNKEMKRFHGGTKYCSLDCYRSNKTYEKKCGSIPGYKERLNRESVARAHKVRDFLRKYKLEKGCADCGFIGHFVALQFDHVRGEKKIEVCKAKSIKRAQEEIEKCEVVCANCHQIRTFKRLELQGKTI